VKKVDLKNQGNMVICSRQNLSKSLSNGNAWQKKSGVLIFIHSLVLSLEGRTWQERQLSHVTSMALAHCMLGKFLGVVCHCFPPPLDVLTFSCQVPPSAMTREILAAKGGSVGEKDVW